MIRCIIVCALLGVTMLGQGCASMRDYSLHVVDGETGEPLAGAQVEVLNTGGALSLSRTRSTTTDDAGRAIARVLPPRRGYSHLRIKAAGYGDLAVPLRSAKAMGLTMEEVNGERRWRAPMYRTPRAKLIIVLPDGYRGPLFVDVYRDDAGEAEAAQQREFIARPNDAGYVRVDAPLVLWREMDPWLEYGRMEVRYENGEPIPVDSLPIRIDFDSLVIGGQEPASPAAAERITLRSLECHRHHYTPRRDDSARIERRFIVGTLEDEAAFYDEMRVMLNRLFEHQAARGDAIAGPPRDVR